MTAAATLAVRVQRKSVEAQDICSFELVSADGATLPAFSAGSHIDVHGPTGLVRQYSLCNVPSDGGSYVIAVLRDPNSRGGSLAMHQMVNEGDVLQISSPKNHFPLSHDSSSSLLLAGGIGITPILCMAQRLCNLGSPFALHYFARSPKRTAFYRKITESPFGNQSSFYFSEGAGDGKPELRLLLADQLPHTHLYVCGPSGFIDSVLGAARDGGWNEELLHSEFFGALVPAAAEDRAFDVKIASTGQVFHVPRDISILHALSAQGIEVPFSCEQGVCGTCLTGVLQGTPDHRDHFLGTAEQKAGDQFTPCCSRSKSAMLVLDL